MITDGIFNGEALTEFQIRKRTVMVEALINYMQGCNGCKRGPDWRERIHTITFKELESRYLDAFGTPLFDSDVPNGPAQ